MAGLISAERCKRPRKLDRGEARGFTLIELMIVMMIISILIGMALSILMYVPRAARLHATELAVSAERVVFPLEHPLCHRGLDPTRSR